MDESNIVIESTERSKSKPSCRILISDFANMVKAFIGSNYLTIAYAFTQSGLVAGIIGLIAIACVTDHCCHLIVKCKYHAINHVLGIPKSHSTRSVNRNGARLLSSDDDDEEEEKEDAGEAGQRDEAYKQMCRSLTYGDVGKISFGGYGLFIVNFCLLFTQFGFCVGYFIFVGNTMYSLFPYQNTSLHLDYPSSTMAPIVTSTAAPNVSIRNVNQSLSSNTTLTPLTESWVDLNTTLNNISSQSEGDRYPRSVITANTTVIPMFNISDYVDISEAPDLRLLVITPLPIFVGFAFLRDVRHLGFVSVGADISIFVGCFVTLLYICAKFSVSASWDMVNWSTLAVFFGMVTSSYEGIGTIIPIESSMEGNRHNFSRFLHGAIFILSAVLTVFGVMGYLEYGSDTQQMLNKNIPTSNGFGMAINIFLCIGVILTFPLQIYPVIELTELYIFGHGRICGPSRERDEEDDDYGDKANNRGSDRKALLPKEEVKIPAPVAQTVPDEVSTWKRNMIRIIVVLVAAGIAVLMRDLFAYVSAFVGAIGSSVLAYILPCLFHLKLCWHELGHMVKIKDMFIIVFGITASVISLYTTISEVVDKFA